MSVLQEKLSHLSDQITSDISDMTMDDKHKVEIHCVCDEISIIGARSLARRWPVGPYLCKPCHVKTYANDEEKLKKFKRSFAQTAKTPEHKERCSKAAKKLWNDPELRERVSHAVSEDNKTNPKKVEGRRKAVAAFMEKHGKKKLAEKLDGGVLTIQCRGCRAVVIVDRRAALGQGSSASAKLR